MAKWIETMLVESESDPDKFYTVGRRSDGLWGCSCPAWTKGQRLRQDCKHIIRAKDDRAANRIVSVSCPADVLVSVRKTRKLKLGG